MKRLAFLVLVLPLLAACSIYRPLQIEPQRKATPIAPHFSESYYYYDRDQNLFFVMRSTAAGTDGKPVEQVATIRVFWRPRGGVTSMNATSMNATFRYMILTPDAVAMYEGAGFVLLNSKTGAGTMQARVMDSDLRLAQASVNFNDTLGRARMRGFFSAKYDDARTVDLLRDAQQEFFARSLKSKAATGPAETMPAGGPGSMPGTIPASGPATVPATLP